MATAAHWFVDLHISKVNFNGPIMQLEQFFSKIVSIFWFFLSKSNVEQSYLKVYLRLIAIKVFLSKISDLENW